MAWNYNKLHSEKQQSKSFIFEVSVDLRLTNLIMYFALLQTTQNAFTLAQLKIIIVNKLANKWKHHVMVVLSLSKIDCILV